MSSPFNALSVVYEMGIFPLMQVRELDFNRSHVIFSRSVDVTKGSPNGCLGSK